MWADAVSRRRLLALAPLLAAAGYALWVAVPSYWAFAAGFVLWGSSGALQSGATEALVYTELDRLGAAGRYAAVMGRAAAVGTGAVMASMAVAAPAFALGGYPLLGAASVLACLLATAVATAFPEHRERPAETTSVRDHVEILRAGVREARADRSVRRVLLLVPAVTALWGAVEEYVPLLAAETGVAAHLVPLLVLLTAVGGAAGGVLAATVRRSTDRVLAGVLACAALALAAGAASGVAVGFVAVAAAFCGFQMASVLADARLQESITGPARATVTSLAGLGTDLATVLVYGAYGAASELTGHREIFVVSAVPYVLLALLLSLGAVRIRGIRRTRRTGAEHGSAGGAAGQPQLGEDRAVVGAGQRVDAEGVDRHPRVGEHVVDGDAGDGLPALLRPGRGQPEAGDVGRVPVTAGQQVADQPVVEGGVEVTGEHPQLPARPGEGT